MRRDTLQRLQPTEERTVDRVRNTVDQLVKSGASRTGSLVAGAIGRAASGAEPMKDASMLAAIGASIALGKEEHAARRAALTIDLYDLGVSESRRAQLISHAASPQRPMWLASGVRDPELALWMVAIARALVEDTPRGRVFVEDLAEALRVPVRSVSRLKQKLPVAAPAG